MASIRIVRESALAALFLFGLLVSQALAASEPVDLSILRKDGTRVIFRAEIARSNEERRVGLMNRQSLPADHGMLFDFGDSREVIMWMRNTLIPLDMLFADDEGVITHIHANARPRDETMIDSRGPVRYVLEINGGLAARLLLAPGDKLDGAPLRAPE